MQNWDNLDHRLSFMLQNAKNPTHFTPEKSSPHASLLAENTQEEIWLIHSIRDNLQALRHYTNFTAVMTGVKVITLTYGMEQIHFICWLDFSSHSYEVKPAGLSLLSVICKLAFQLVIFPSSLAAKPLHLVTRIVFCSADALKIIQECGNSSCSPPWLRSEWILLAAHSRLILSSRQREICFIFCLHPLASRESKHWK